MDVQTFLKRGEVEGAFIVTDSEEAESILNLEYNGSVSGLDLIDYLIELEDFGHIIELDLDSEFLNTVDEVES